MDDAVLVARELGRLTEAVENMREDLKKQNERHDNLEKRMGRVENKHSTAHGVLWTLGGLIGLLGIDRIVRIFPH